MTYCGPTNSRPSRWRVSWEGWPSEGARKVSRYVPYGYASTDGRDSVMREAADLFAAWLSDMPGDSAKRVRRVESVTYGGLSADSYVLLVTLARE